MRRPDESLDRLRALGHVVPLRADVQAILEYITQLECVQDQLIDQIMDRLRAHERATRKGDL